MNKWKSHKFTSLVDINPRVNVNTQNQYEYIEMKDLSPGFRWVYPSDYRKLKGGARFEEGDTLFARITPCLENGKICQVKNLQQDIGFGSTEFLVFRYIDGISDKDFVFYLASSPLIRRFAENKMVGTSGRQRVNKDAFENLEIPLPPLSTQHRIAEILGALDDKIELNRQMNKTLEEIAMVLYKHWFVDFGPFRVSEFVESELGLIPKGWEVKKIDDVLSISKKTIKPFEFPDEYFYHFSIPAFDDTLFPKYEQGSEIASNKTLIVDDSILISKLNPRIKRIWTVYKPKETTSFSSTEFINYVPKNSSDWAYFNCFLRNGTFYYEFLNHATGTTGSRQRVSPRTTLDFKLVYPSNDILVKFNNIVGDYFRHVYSNILEINSLKQTRDYLLPKLISGEVEVKTAESTIKEVL